MKVLLLSKYSRMGASSRLRSLQYLPSLTDKGIEVTISSLFDDRYLNELYGEGRRSKLHVIFLYLKRIMVLLTVFRYQVVWIEKELFPYFPATFERLLPLLGVRYVVDYDDAIFHNYDLSDNYLIRTFLARKIDVVMARAACVVAGNQYLADRAVCAGCGRVEVIPTVVDHTRYSLSSGYGPEKLVIGWIGSPSTQRYVVDIQNALRVVCSSLGARVVLVGATQEVVGHMPGVPIEVLPWSEDSEVENIAKMDVGIMPLLDGPWERGKCGYKLIQYMASGVPVVASSVGVNVEIVQRYGCGRLADSEDAWVESLIDLLRNPDLRRTSGRAGREAVVDHYSLQSQGAHWAKIFTTLAR